LKFLLDENVPISIKDVIHDLGFDAFTLYDFVSRRTILLECLCLQYPNIITL